MALNLLLIILAFNLAYVEASEGGLQKGKPKTMPTTTLTPTIPPTKPVQINSTGSKESDSNFCDSDYLALEGRYTCISTLFAPGSFEEAQTRCLSGDSNLIKIDSKELDEEIRGYIDDSKLYWIGLLPSPTGDSLAWTADNSTFPEDQRKDFFATALPNASKNCIAKDGSIIGGKSWKMDDCTAKYNFICEKPSHNAPGKPTLTIAGSTATSGPIKVKSGTKFTVQCTANVNEGKLELFFTNGSSNTKISMDDSRVNFTEESVKLGNNDYETTIGTAKMLLPANSDWNGIQLMCATYKKPEESCASIPRYCTQGGTIEVVSGGGDGGREKMEDADDSNMVPAAIGFLVLLLIIGAFCLGLFMRRRRAEKEESVKADSIQQEVHVEEEEQVTDVETEKSELSGEKSEPQNAYSLSEVDGGANI